MRFRHDKTVSLEVDTPKSSLIALDQRVQFEGLDDRAIAAPYG